jgi:hypothetical protein
LLRGWFLDPATRMNPNLNFGQAVPGRVDGRGTGIIDTAGLVELTRGLDWLENSAAWTKADRDGMKKWFAAYLDWLETSKNGLEERDAKNNHGTWYDAQVVALALATGRNDLAKVVLESAKSKRIDAQIKEDGSQPLELARTKSLGYSLMNLRACFELATMGEKAGVDLWHTRIHAALDYVALYIRPDKIWPHQELDGETQSDLADLATLLRRSQRPYNTCRACIEFVSARTQLLWPETCEALCH